MTAPLFARTGIGLLALAAVAACGGQDSSDLVVSESEGNVPAAEVQTTRSASAPPLDRCAELEGGAAGYDEVYHFESLETWAAHADLVVTATVTGEAAGPETVLTDETEIARDLTLTIDEVLLGDDVAAGTRFVMRSHEPWLEMDGRRAATAGPGCFRLEVDDRIIAALVGDGENADNSALLTTDSVFILGPDDEVVDTMRTNPVVADLEGLTAQELRKQVQALGGR